MTDEMIAIDAQLSEQRPHIGRKPHDRQRAGTVQAAIEATQVHRDHTIVLREFRNLVFPVFTRGAKAVQQDERRATARLFVIKLDAINLGVRHQRPDWFGVQKQKAYMPRGSFIQRRSFTTSACSNTRCAHCGRPGTTPRLMLPEKVESNLLVKLCSGSISSIT